MRPWTTGEPLHLAAGTIPESYRIAPDGTIEGPGTDGKPVRGKVAFLVGGRHREDTLVRLDDGRLQVFPVAYDVDRSRAFEPLRELAGGKTPPSDVVDFWTRVGRNADLACYGCHATGQTVSSQGVSPAGLTLPGSRWLEPGVGCEGCHGPGGPHITAARGGKPAPETLRMPGRDGLRIVDACAGCHGLRDVLSSPFSDEPAHRYGESVYGWADPLLGVASNFEFRDPFFPDLRPATYQQEATAFSQSSCARKGGMTCAACHDVHSGSATAALAAADGGDSICRACHADIAARGDRHTLHPKGTPGGRCLDCHMAPILRGPGALPARDHTLAPPVAGPGEIPAACVACHAGKPNGPAVAEAWKRVVPGPAARRRAELDAAVRAPSEGAALAALARIASDADRGWFLRWAAIQRIASTATGPATEAVAATLRAALSDPNPAIRRAAARALGRAGKPSDVGPLQAASADDDPWAALEAAHGMAMLGSPTAGARLLQLLKRPDLIADARAQYAFGHACLVGRDYPRAETAFRRALEINPMMVGAISDLGLAQLGQDKREEARASWRRALEINPRYAAARQNLEGSFREPAKP